MNDFSVKDKRKKRRRRRDRVRGRERPFPQQCKVIQCICDNKNSSRQQTHCHMCSLAHPIDWQLMQITVRLLYDVTK